MKGDSVTTRERLIRRGDYIGGCFVKPERVDGYIVGVNPGDKDDTLGRFFFSSTSVDEAVNAAARGGAAWRLAGRAERVRAVRAYRDNLHHHQDATASLITRENGKPLWEARQEVVAAIRAIDLLIEEGLALLEPRVLNEREARSDYRPRGVVGILSPYTFPLLTPTLQTSAALLSGNTVVFKPSKFTPGVGQCVAEFWDRSKLPRGAFNLIQGSGAGIGQRLATHPGLDALLVSGTYKTASAIRRATVNRPELPVLFESGGKGSAIVLEGCDLDRAVYETMVGAFLTAGQRHNSTARAIVTSSVFDAFVARLVEKAGQISVGYGADPGTFMGPVISENVRKRYRRYILALKEAGHTPLLEGGSTKVSYRKGFYVNPGVYQVHWEQEANFLNEEPPGPVLLVYKVDNWQDAIALHNKLVYRISTSVFVPLNHEELPDMLSRLKTGAINLNRGSIGSSLRLPSVGLGRSSNGLPAGIDLLRFLSVPRATLVEFRPFDPNYCVPGINWDPQELQVDDWFEPGEGIPTQSD